jgi:putative spermidine/putrescine transport system ATP-binding protein
MRDPAANETKPVVQGASLSLAALRKDFGNSTAVRSIDLDLKPGRFLTLLGASGSGKTTTLMMIAGFVEPTSGAIRINGRDVTSLPAHKRDIGMVFQNYALFPHLTVIDNVGFALKMRGVSKKEIKERSADFLRMVGLADFAMRYPNQLSGGQQQRVALARALVFSPPLVLMDEPLGALDRRLRLQMQEEIKRIQMELGLTVVYVTHDQEEALTMSDDIAVMEDGRIASHASPRQTYEAPENRFTANFIGESNFLEGKVRSQQGQSVEIEIAGQPCLVAAGEKLEAEGRTVSVFLRPERLRLVTECETIANAVPCKLISELYLGESIIYTVMLADGQKLRIRRPNRGIGVEINAAMPLWVGFEPKNARVLSS